MNKKIIFFNIIVYLLFLIITIRLFDLQIINKTIYLEKLSSKNNKIVYGDTSLRGRIYDTNNILLVDNKLIPTIIYKKEEGMNREDEFNLAKEVIQKLDLDYSKLTMSYLKDFYLLDNSSKIENRLDNSIIDDYKHRKISNDEFYQLKKRMVTDNDLSIYSESDLKAIYLYYLMNSNYSYMDKIIKENCTLEEFMYFSENNHNLHGFNTKYNYGRVYLYNDTLKNIFGNVGNITVENKDYYLSKGYNISDKVGLSNLELIYDDELKGEREMYIISGKDKLLIKEAKRGKDIKLTIDINIQKYIDSVLEREVKKAKSGYNTKYYNHSYVLVTDTQGNILAMSGKQIINGKIVDVAIGNITDTITAGSVVKGASMIVGYTEGAIKIGEVIKDECIKIKDTPKKCSVYTMGNINDINALAYSSNVYQFKTAIRVGGGKYRYNQSLKINNNAFDIYRDYFASFGLGVNTGIELYNESRGYKGTTRDVGLLLNFAIGQYDTYTNIQLNQYISTIAQNGKRYKMHLLKAIINDDIVDEVEPVILNEVKTESKYIDRVKKGLKAVTTYGSGKNYVQVNASGKTGTSESFMDYNNDGKIDTETISTNFVMYMPSNNPKIAISINSPNISTPNKGYKYPINQIVIKDISKYINNYLKLS